MNSRVIVCPITHNCNSKNYNANNEKYDLQKRRRMHLHIFLLNRRGKKKIKKHTSANYK